MALETLLTNPIAINNSIELNKYKDESELSEIMDLISKDLSEPYSIFTYRFFLTYWPHLCFLARTKEGLLVGVIISKIEHYKGHLRGYIAMLAVNNSYRKLSIGSSLVKFAVLAMKQCGADEVVLEAENKNHKALNLYQKLGFIKSKRLHRYYLTGADAYRLKLIL